MSVDYISNIVFGIAMCVLAIVALVAQFHKLQRLRIGCRISEGASQESQPRYKADVERLGSDAGRCSSIDEPARDQAPERVSRTWWN